MTENLGNRRDGYQASVSVAPQLPSTFVDHPVMAMTEQHQIGQSCGRAVRRSQFDARRHSPDGERG